VGVLFLKRLWASISISENSTLRRKQWSVRLQWSRMPRGVWLHWGFRLHRGVWLYRGYPGPPGWGLGLEAEAYTKILPSCKIYIHSEKFMHIIMYLCIF